MALAAPVRVVAAAPVTVSQSTFLVGALVAFFILWLAANGRLLTYWNLLTGGGAPGGSAGATGGDTKVDPGTGSGFSPTVPFSTDWWNNFLRPWGLAK